MALIASIIGYALIFIICFLIAKKNKEKGKNHRTPLIVAIVIYALAGIGAFAGGNIINGIVSIICVVLAAVFLKTM